MKIGDFKKFSNGLTVICNKCDYYDVYMIDIDEDRIELSDQMGMVIGTISTSELNNCEVINYDDNGRMCNLGDLNEL